MAEQRVLIIGHSFVHRLKAFVQKKRHMQAFSSLSGIADIYFHGVGCRTIAKFRKFDFHVVRQLVPDVIILELGSNDLVELSPQTVRSELESLVNALCPVLASSIFKWRRYNTFMRCCVTCTFTTLQAISYVIMHFKCFIVACFVLDIYGYFGVLLTWRLLFTTLVCPTHSSHYRTNVLFTMSRIIFCHYVACS